MKTYTITETCRYVVAAESADEARARFLDDPRPYLSEVTERDMEGEEF